MHRQPLLNLLARYKPTDQHDQCALNQIIDFVQSEPCCFQRECMQGHITASAWLLHPDGHQFLLTHHRKLRKWLQLGGHADGDNDVLGVALREAIEESGISEIMPISEEIFDVDVHVIPAYKNVPAHNHYDIRFLLQAKSPDYKTNDAESLNLSWFNEKTISELDIDLSVQRMCEKQLMKYSSSLLPL